MATVPFNLGQIQHPTHGKAEVIGELQFVLPAGKYKYPVILDEPENLKEVVKKVFPACRELWPELLDEEIKPKVEEFVRATAFVIPTDLEDEPSRVIIFSHILRATFEELVNSNILEDPDLQAEEGGPAMTYKDLLVRVKTTELSNEGIQNTIDEIPALLPEISNLKNFIAKLHTQMKASLPEALDKVSHEARVAMLQDISAIIIFREMEQSGRSFSYTTRLHFDRYMQGVKSQIEFQAICLDIHLPADIRNDVLFITLMNSFVDIVMLVNSILALPKTIKSDAEEDVGPIMHLVLQQKLTLEEALTEVKDWLKESYHDYRLTVDKLHEVYGEDENLIKYVQLLGYFLDGSTHRYKNTKQWALKME